MINLSENLFNSNRGLSSIAKNESSEPTIVLPTPPTNPKGKWVFSLSVVAAEMLNLNRDGEDRILFFVSTNKELYIINDQSLREDPSAIRVNKSLNLSNKNLGEYLINELGFEAGSTLHLTAVADPNLENVVKCVSEEKTTVVNEIVEDTREEDFI